MNRYLGNICISAVSAVAGGTIMHITDTEMMENLKIENNILKSKNDILESDNDSLRRDSSQLQMFLNYYKKKYNDKITIVNVKVIQE